MAKGGPPVKRERERESPIVRKRGGIFRVRNVMASTGPNRHSLIIVAVLFLTLFVFFHVAIELVRLEDSKIAPPRGGKADGCIILRMNPSHEAQRTHFYLILFLPIVCLFTWVAHRCISLFTDFVPFTCLFISQHLFFYLPFLLYLLFSVDGWPCHYL